jgi:hypothetical protein
MRRRLRHDSNRQTPDPETVQDNRRIIQISQHMHAEGIDKTVTDEDGRIDPDRLACGRRETGLDRSGGGDEACAAETDSRGDCELLPGYYPGYLSPNGRGSDLSHKIEPPRQPRQERRMFFRRQHRGPKVGTAAGGDGGDDLGHRETDEEGHE